MSSPGRLVILSGPSCVGKSPLVKALARHYPELRRSLQPLTLYNDRAPRPGEVDGVDYHFRTRGEVEALWGEPRHVVIEVRGDMQALDLGALEESLARGDVLFEGNPFVGRVLQTHGSLQHVTRLGAFMAPLSREEILHLREQGADLPALVTDVMRRKLLRRTRRQKGELSVGDLENVEKRAGSAYQELREAHHFPWVLPCHDGEDSENWDAFYHVLGDARRALLSFVALLEGRDPPWGERWEEDLLPEQ